jgi:maltose O-acetyltransferase
MLNETEKMVAGAFFLLRRRCGLVKDRRRAKNLLHRLNVGIPSDKKHGKSKELIPNAGAIFYVEPPFHCDYGYNMW